MKEAYYFSHDSNARHDPKITAMRGVYGSEGYGWYWMLIEMMRESEGYKLDLKSKYTWNAFALQLHCDSNRIEEFVNDCIQEFSLFEADDCHFWSPSLLRRMEFREQKSKARSKAAKARWDKEKRASNDTPVDAENMQMHSKSNANAMQGKESKVNESKGKERKRNLKDNPPVSPRGEHTRFISPSREEVAAYCNERNNGVDAGKWYDHYTSNGWMVGRNKMKDWKAAVRTWEKGVGSYAKPRSSTERGRGEFDSLSL